MLRRADNAALTLWGIFRRKRPCLQVSARGEPIFLSWSAEEWNRVWREQRQRPVRITTHRNRQYWIYHEKIYWDNDDLKQSEVEALLKERESRKRQQIDRAMRGPKQVVGKRQPISQDVKIYVWRRDEGRCVQCGSQTNLEYDHIIPTAMGGSNTARNIQLLCEPCNRAKGGRLA